LDLLDETIGCLAEAEPRRDDWEGDSGHVLYVLGVDGAWTAEAELRREEREGELQEDAEREADLDDEGAEGVDDDRTLLEEDDEETKVDDTRVELVKGATGLETLLAS
jgi:hypothetical protein